MKSNEQPVLIYDGECNLCTGAVKFLKAEKASSGLKFIPSSDPSSDSLLEKHHIHKSTTDKTVILFDGERIFTKSSAIIRSIQMKGLLWRLAGVFFIVPAFVRDKIYDWIAGIRK